MFVTLFLYIFKPFGISQLEENTFLICLGFGSMTLVGALLFEGSFGVIGRMTGWNYQWTFGKWLVSNIGIVIFISLANFIFARLAIFGYIDWSLFPAMLYGTFMIGIVALTAAGTVMLLVQEKRYQQVADEFNQSATFKRSDSDPTETILFGIPSKDIRYVEALQNYVRIAYIDTDRNLVHHTERVPLKNVAKEAEGTSITRCHRSFLVNRNQITSVSGNAQGLQLRLNDVPHEVLVSRSYVKEFRS